MPDPNSPLFRFQLWRAGLPPALRLLLTVNLATYLAFLLAVVLAMFGVRLMEAVDWLKLSSSPAVVLTRPWTPLTYGFVNAFGGFLGLISFVFGFYWLNWIGRDLEETYGGGFLFGTYLLGALGGAALALILALLLPTVPFRPYFGVWTPTTAVLCALATLQPDRQIGLFLLGVIPMRWVAIGFVFLSLVFSGDLTVVGASLAGYGLAKAYRSGRDLTAWAGPLFAARRRRPSPAAPRRSPFARSAPATTPPSRSAGLRDVDAILDKILEKGYDSLTPEEREILARAGRD